MMSSQISNVTYKGIEISCDVVIFHLKQLRIQIFGFKGRIETIPVDAIAVSCDSNFTLNVGIGKAIRNAGGPLFLVHN
jgi:hypothetical protein